MNRKLTHPVPKVGDTVVLNDAGIERLCDGFTHMKTLKMKVLWVDSESITFPEPTYEIKVDNPEIDKYMIDHWLFDIVEPGS